MKAEDIMTPNPACCGTDTPLTDIARMMVEDDVGLLPVVDEAGRPVGVITDRDVAYRSIPQKHDMRALVAADCMTAPIVAVARDDSLDECCDLLETNQIRRVLVIDDDGSCCGILALADIARYADRDTRDRVGVSRPPRETPLPGV